MFTLKLIKSSINSSRINYRPISAGTGRLLGFFKDEIKEENTLEVIDAYDEDVDSELEMQRINQLRNKSGLRTAHWKMLHGEVPYDKAQSWVHQTLKYQRKLYGKLGDKSGLDPRICFWTKKELEEKQEYERIAYPTTVPEMIAIDRKEKQEKREKIQKREEEIATKLLKLDQWKKDIIAKKDKKETEARVAKDRKDRLIEEVRRHFGYTIDPRDERFKELLDQKEKAQKKALKESKRVEKEKKMVAKLAENDKGKKDKVEKAEVVEEDDDEDKQEKVKDENTKKKKK